MDTEFKFEPVTRKQLMQAGVSGRERHLYENKQRLTSGYRAVSRRPMALSTSSQAGASVWTKFAAVSGLAAVALGAYGAHAFKPQNPAYKEVWKTANLYHLVHSAALLAAPIAKRPNVFGGLMAFGIVAFSGSCYVAAAYENRSLSKAAPLGGIGFMAGWLASAF